MKNIKKIALVTGLSCLLMTGCNDDTFLRENPEDFLTVDNSFLNVNQFKTGVNRMYSQTRAFYNDNDNRNDWVLMGIGVDVFTTSTPDNTASQPEFNDWQKVSSDNGVANRWWRDTYGIVKNANELLFQTENENVVWHAAGQKEEIQAEIRFFRAYAYRCLANIFGGVPILDKPVTEPRLDFVRATRAEVYKFAMDDAEFAAKYLPIKMTQDGRVVRATASHLLAEICIAYSDNGGEKSYDKAIAAATNVVDGSNGDYGLMTERFGSRKSEEGKDVFWDLFRMGNQNYMEAGNKECLWAIQFAYNTPSGTNKWDRPLFERHFWPNFWANKKHGYNGIARDNTGRGVGYVRPTTFMTYTVWNKSEGDIRNSDANISRKFYAPKVVKGGVEVDYDTTYVDKVTLANGNVIEVRLKPGDEIKREWMTTAQDTMSRFYPRFYKFGTDKHINGKPDNGFIPDWYIFRVAGTYLLRAEAHLKAGNKAAAADDINMVRRRANAPLIDASQVNLDYILDERARELMGEEQRYMTLSRMNAVYDRTTRFGRNKSAESIKEYNNLFPIPQSAIDANLEAKLEQNPGY